MTVSGSYLGLLKSKYHAVTLLILQQFGPAYSRLKEVTDKTCALAQYNKEMTERLLHLFSLGYKKVVAQIQNMVLIYIYS